MSDAYVRMISEGVPSDFSHQMLPASSIYSAVEDFFDEYFRGAVIIDGDRIAPGYLDMSADGLAFFFKLLFKAAYGESTVKINISSENYFYHIRSQWKKRKEITEKEIFELKNAASFAGFNVHYYEEDGSYNFHLWTKIKVSNVLRVYANSFQTFRHTLTRVFFLT